MLYMLTLCMILASTALANGQPAPVQPSPVPESVISNTFAGREGTLVIVDCSAGTTSTFRPQVAAGRFAPCSTFKIWNTLIGLESGIVASPGQLFHHWDGEKRSFPEWNRDLTLLEAFQVSCVPAFQNLARQIGADRMQSWIEKIEYGDRDTSAGVDVFWLPAKDRKTILISPAEQAQLMNKLVNGKLPFSKTSLAVLKDLMTVKKTDKGVLFGKTGSGAILGWFVGYMESNGKTQVFACMVRGENVTGKDARAVVETVFERQGVL
jgi:beta-lactamase class D